MGVATLSVVTFAKQRPHPFLYHRRQRKEESELAHVGDGKTNSNLVNPSCIQSKSSYNCLS